MAALCASHGIKMKWKDKLILKSSIKKHVLSFDLNVVRLLQVLMSAGNWFHSLGAEMAKALAPYVFM